MEALTIIEGPQFSITVPEEFVSQCKLARATSAQIDEVLTPEDNEVATRAQAGLKECLSAIEKARKAVKEPFLERGRLIDAHAKKISEPLSAEIMRIAALAGDYQQQQLEKVRIAERARAAEMDRIQREQQEAEAKARAEQEAAARVELARIEAERERAVCSSKSAAATARIEAETEAKKNSSIETFKAIAHAEIERQAALAQQQREALGAAPVLEKAAGQVIKEDWELNINLNVLARYHPDLVNIEARVSDIKQRLNEGRTITGVEAKKVVKAQTRKVGNGKAIDV